MGEVYRARDTRLHREVPVKVVPRSSPDASDRQRRFEQEARAASPLDRPAILAIHDFGEHDGSPHVVGSEPSRTDGRFALGQRFAQGRAREQARRVERRQGRFIGAYEQRNLGASQGHRVAPAVGKARDHAVVRVA